MARTAEEILEDVLSSMNNMNDLQRDTADIIRSGLRSGGGGSGGGGGNSGNTPSRLATLGSAALELSKSLMSATTAAGATGAGFGALSAATSVIPVFGNSLSIAVEATQAFYEYMNDQLNMFKQVNESGYAVSGGMFGLQEALVTGRIDLEGFLGATSQYRDVIASMGSDGVQNFNSLVDSVIRTSDEMGMLGVTNEALAASMASYLKIQKSYGVFDKMNKQEQAMAARRYMDSLNEYSKGLGMSLEEIKKGMDDTTDSVAGLGTQLSLQSRGMSEADAAESTKNLNMVLSSFGEFGSAINQQFSRFLEFGDLDLESPIGQMYQANEEFRNLFDSMKTMAETGQMSSEEGAQRLREMLASKNLTKSIDESLTTMRGAFSDAATNQIVKWRNLQNNYNMDIEKSSNFWDEQINKFNLTIEEMFQGFKLGSAKLFTDPEQFIKEMFGETWGDWLWNGAFNFETSDIPVFSSGLEFMRKLIPVEWFWDALTGYGEGVSARFADVKEPSWEAILRAICPQWLSDIILGKDGSILGMTDMASNASKAITDQMEVALNHYAEVVSSGATFLDETVKASADGWSSAFDALAAWVAKPSQSTSISNSTINNQNSVVQPVTNVVTPEKRAAEKQVDDMKKQQQHEEVAGILKEVAKASKETGAVMSEMIQYVKRTADNTAAGQVN